MQRLQRDLRRAWSEYGPKDISGIRHIHLSDGMLSGLAPMLRSFFPDRTISMHLHGLDVVYPNSLYQRLLCSSLSSVDRIVCNSSATACEALRRGALKEQIVVIPPGVWSVGSGPLGGRPGWKGPDPFAGPTLLTVGRLIPRKGHVWFIENVLPHLRDVRYVIIGSGSEELRIRERVRRLGLDEIVTLITDAKDAVRDACYGSADLFLMPNVPVRGDMEGFGIACIEASLRGLPVAASNLEGIPDAMIPGETGVLFTPLDPESCAAAITSLLEKRPDAAAVSSTTLRAFSWESLIHRYAHEVFC